LDAAFIKSLELSAYPNTPLLLRAAILSGYNFGGPPSAPPQIRFGLTPLATERCVRI